MADLYELVLALDLRADLTPDDLAELRWHLGQGEQPGPDPDPDLEPAFAETGPAYRIGGALVAALMPRERPDGWALTVRQELHPDQFDTLRAMLGWLGRRARYDGYAGYLRFYEEAEAAPLMVHNGQIELPQE